MSDHIYTNQAFFDKADYEGGLLEMIFNYEVNPDRIEPGEVRDLVIKIQQVAPLLAKLQLLSYEYTDYE